MAISTIFAGLKVAKFFGTVYTWIGAAITSLFQVIGKYPKQSLAVLLIAVAGWFLHSWAFDKGADSRDKEIAALKAKIEEQGEQLAEYQLQASDRAEKIKGLEESSKEAGKKAAEELALANKQFAAVVNTYEKRLADAKKNPTIKYETIYVKVPGVGEHVQVTFEDGIQVCNQYPSGYKETINDLVRITNEALTSGVSK